jgi:hypothetical protein
MAAAGALRTERDHVEIVLRADGRDETVSLTDAARVPFEDTLPVRSFPSYRGQRSNSGLWWFATTGAHVGFESWFERDHLMLLDFDADVVGAASQPFWIRWWRQGSARRHAPDYFARRCDGSVIVFDCRPRGRIKARDQEAFDATAAACRLVGWDYEVVDGLDPIIVANVRWLSGYRHPRYHGIAMATKVLDVLGSGPSGVLETAKAVGDPLVVLPVVYHLMWRQVLVADLAVPMNATSQVAIGGREA